LGRAGRALAALFPEAPQAPAAAQRPPAAGARLALANLAAIALGACVMLVRPAGTPPWDTVRAEDRFLYLPQALLHPWRSLAQPYAGYYELVPRLVAEVAARLPLARAGAVFAVAGALAASCTAILVFHASAGHVRRLGLRLLLTASVLLLPTALITISDTAVNAPWYLLFGTFWALLWRPASRPARVAAALLCFAAASSTVLAVLYLPVAAARVIALPRWREHWATAGWLAGCLVQLPAEVTSARQIQPPPFAHAVTFYLREVLLAAFTGYHGAQLLRTGAGLGGAVAIAACAVLALAAWALVSGGPQVRALVVTCAVLGFLLTLGPVLTTGRVANYPVPATTVYVRGSRYAQVPVLLTYSWLIAAADARLRRGWHGLWRAAHATVACLLAALLLASWASDFRYSPSPGRSWPVAVARAQRDCRTHPWRSAKVLTVRLPCSKWAGRG
jgi:hypothetical protein